MNIFGKALHEYWKMGGIFLILVAFIGIFQLWGAFVAAESLREYLRSIGFLRITQVIWVILVAAGILRASWKKDFGIGSSLFLGVLFLVAFGVIKVLARGLLLGHDWYYLMTQPFVECVIYIMGISIIMGAVGILIRGKKW